MLIGGSEGQLNGSMVVHGEGKKVAFGTSSSIVVTTGRTSTETWIGDDSPKLGALTRGELLVSSRAGLQVPHPGVMSMVDDEHYAEDELVSTPAGAVFVSKDPGSGSEIFFTNGRRSQLVTEIIPGAASSKPRGLVALGERVFYTATDANGDEELYVVTPPTF